MSYHITKEEDQKFMATLLKDIPYFHKLYAKYKDPISLEIVKDLDIASVNLKNKIANHDYAN